MFVYKRSQVFCCLLFVIFWHDSTLAQHTTNATIAVCVQPLYLLHHRGPFVLCCNSSFLQQDSWLQSSMFVDNRSKHCS